MVKTPVPTSLPFTTSLYERPGCSPRCASALPTPARAAQTSRGMTRDRVTRELRNQTGHGRADPGSMGKLEAALGTAQTAVMAGDPRPGRVKKPTARQKAGVAGVRGSDHRSRLLGCAHESAVSGLDLVLRRHGGRLACRPSPG